MERVSGRAVLPRRCPAFPDTLSRSARCRGFRGALFFFRAPYCPHSSPHCRLVRPVADRGPPRAGAAACVRHARGHGAPRWGGRGSCGNVDDGWARSPCDGADGRWARPPCGGAGVAEAYQAGAVERLHLSRGLRGRRCRAVAGTPDAGVRSGRSAHGDRGARAGRRCPVGASRRSPPVPERPSRFLAELTVARSRAVPALLARPPSARCVVGAGPAQLRGPTPWLVRIRSRASSRGCS